jgi:hypothetical protein
MDKIWTNLPYDLVRHILNFMDDIDTRLHFGILPRKLHVPRNFELKSEYVYLSEKQKLFDFSGMCETNDGYFVQPQYPYYVVREGITFDMFVSPNYHIFNLDEDGYDMTMYSEDVTMGPSKCYNQIDIFKKVKFV